MVHRPCKPSWPGYTDGDLFASESRGLEAQPRVRRRTRNTPSMTRFFVSFIAILVVLFVLQLTPWGQSAFVVPVTGLIAQISAELLQLWDPR